MMVISSHFPWLMLGWWTSSAMGNDYRSLCGHAESYIASGYIVNNNAWNEDDSGSICTYVLPNATSFTSLWSWTTNPPAVRAFPNIGIYSSSLPIKLTDLYTVEVSAAWALAPSSLIAGASDDPTTNPDSGAIAANHLQCNVVLDMFADEDEVRSRVPTEQKYELMVWFGSWGAGAKPIGNAQVNNPPIVVTLDASDFTLYNGTNSNGQSVFSWVANNTLTAFDLDIAPLIGFLVANDYIPATVYLGTVQFGSETSFASREVNFTVHTFEAHVNVHPTSLGGGSATLPVATLVTASAIPIASASAVPEGGAGYVQVSSWTVIMAWAFVVGYCGGLGS